MKLKYIICRGDYIFFASLHLQVALSVCLSVCLPTGLLKKVADNKVGIGTRP